MTDVEYLTTVLRMFHHEAESRGLLLSYAPDPPRLMVVANDLLQWASSDGEVVEPEDLPLLRKCLDELLALEDCSEVYLGEYFVCAKRGHRPQRPWLNECAREGDVDRLLALFEACGPEMEPWIMPLVGKATS